MLKLILEEEIGHVHFGVKWFKFLCEQDQTDPKMEYLRFLNSQKVKIRDPNVEARELAGFNFYS